jgi:CheY-like chemotaxis protein
MNVYQRQPLVLAIDDDPEVLQEVTAVMESAGYSCRCCTSGEEAITSAGLMPPDLIVCDINLHGHSGLTLCERIKEDPMLKMVPVMFLSASQIPDIIRRGDAYYLRKPFDPDVLLELAGKAVWIPPLVNSDVQP